VTAIKHPETEARLLPIGNKGAACGGARHPSAHAAGIDELAVIGVVAKQQRPEIRTRSFGVGPANDDEFLTVQPFCFAP
jgi:hypothetical protein